MAKDIVTLPYAPEREVICPACGRPSTEYHPAERYGRCFDPPLGCGFRWKLEPYKVRIGLPWHWFGRRTRG